MVNIIPMSGSGSRFSDVGYLLPKPLIPLSGQPMINRVIDSMPKADKWIFIVRQEHVEKYELDKYIKTKLPEAIIVVEDKPWGQAPSCMLAMPFVEDNEDIFIAACDNSFIYNAGKFEAIKNDPTVDAVIWTFTNNKLLADKPEAWGWVKLGSDNSTIIDMSVKVPVSNNPLNDHAVVATFYFKKASEFKKAYGLMVEQNFRINNEFYIDSMPIFYNHIGKKSVIFDVDLYIGWGKPSDLYEYELREYYYSEHLGACQDTEKDKELWQRYFDSIIS